MATRVYVGRVPYEARESDVERFFKGYGRLEHVLMKRGFCYVEFQDARDASDAIAELNGKSILGDKVIVEQARSREESRRGGGGGDRYGGGGDRYGDRRGPPARRGYQPDSRDRDRRRSRSPAPRRRDSRRSRSRSRSSSANHRRQETRRSPSY